MPVRWIFERFRFRSAQRLTALALAAIMLCAGADAVSIVRDRGAFRVDGWPAPATPPSDGWSSIFVISTAVKDAPPLLGDYSVESGSLVFRPRFTVSPGVPVHARFRQPGRPDVVVVFRPVDTATLVPSTRVAAVYPSSDVVPANLLKFYLHFSAPMQRGEAWQHIRLLDQHGKPVDLPFLEIDQELWDPGNQRLTVLFDPGRIKRGVLPRENTGGALEPGNSYTLQIDRSWTDANGLPLAAGHSKTFRVAGEDRVPIDPKSWKVTPPREGTRDSLHIDLPDPADQALLERMLSVACSGNEIAGRVSTGNAETRWTLEPVDAWSAGECRIIIDTALEDLAGNRIGRAFDVDVFERVSRRVTSKTVSLSFRVGG
jgi:hypothetical protein